MFATVGGGLALAGWATGTERLTDWDADGITMKANAACCMCAAAVGLLMAADPRFRQWAWVLGLFTLVVGAATLSQHVFGVSLGIDTLLFQEAPGANATAAPGRMGPPASLSFTLLGLGLMLVRSSTRARLWASRLGLTVVSIAAFPLLGYIYGASQLYALAHLTGIAFQTAIMLVALGVGLTASVSEVGLAASLMRRDAGGLALRRLIVAVLLVPVALGWACVAGHQAGFYDAALGVALLVLTQVVVLVGLLRWTAGGVSAQDEMARVATAARREREELLRLVTEEARVGLVVVDRQRRYRFTNATYADFLGRREADLVGKPVADVIGPLRDETTRLLDRAFAGQDVHDTAEMSLGDEGPRFYQISCEPRGLAGDDPHVVMVVVDITARVEAERRLEDAHRRKDEFLATLAHELRNPLAPLSSSMDVLERTQDPAAAARARGVMRRQLGQMVRLVDDLLDVNRITRGSLELRKERVDLRQALSVAEETSAALLQASGHRLELSIPDRPVWVDGDPTRLAQVFGNLLNNAAKYMDPGGTIWLAVEPTEGRVAIRVRDQGIGIPKPMLRHVFDMFTRVAPVERAQGGLGVGLSLAKRLIEMHGGTIEVKSPPEDDSAAQGTEVLVTLPTVASGAISAAVAPVSAREQASRPLRVVVADDNTDTRETIAELLEEMGHEARVAQDGAEAVAAVQASRADLALLDVGMPEVDGCEAARRIRREPWGKDVMLVAVTGWGRTEDRMRIRDAGFDQHVVKPLQLAALEGLIREAETRAETRRAQPPT